jgi:aryl-alcohol dehydrogenase-like predicted oxidoreductase
MHTRILGKTGAAVSEVGLGTWQLGGDWGDVRDDEALKILHKAADMGVNFFDTADVYGDGRSEQLIGKFLKEVKHNVIVATKIGRRQTPGWPDNFKLDVMRQHIEESLKRLGVDALDLVQLHCIPTQTLMEGQVFDNLQSLKREGKIKNYGVSVESMEEALICLGHDDVVSLQIIFNIFRQKPVNQLFEKAKQKKVAIIARVPLASGLLSGKITKDTRFTSTDHRNYNRDGQAFNVGETFAGLPQEKGAELADELKKLVPEGMTMAQMALRWILDFDAVSTVIPGASTQMQLEANASASDIPPLSKELHKTLSDFYAQSIVQHIRGLY